MTITYPKNLAEYKALKFDYNNDKLSVEDRIIAESFITHWRVLSGAYTLGVLTKLTGKRQQDVASDLGIKPRHLSGMINGVNTISNTKDRIIKYFNIKEELLNDYSRSFREKG
jgi:hypothetical protein